MQFRTFRRLALLASSICALLTISMACQQETTVSLKIGNQMPLLFSFVGNGLASEFEVLELPRTEPLNKTDPFRFSGKTIWKISNSENTVAAKWPQVSYGDIPRGFSQGFPKDGAPERLVEAKLYAAKVSGRDENAVLFFEIDHGSPVNVTNDVFKQ